jgi:hypothetical protein
MTAFALAVILRMAGGLRSGVRAVGRWTGAYFRRRALQESARRAELWWRLRMDLSAATELWIRLNNELADHDQVRELLSRLRKEHPEYAPFIDAPEQRTRAELARLEETVQHVHGGWGAA